MRTIRRVLLAAAAAVLLVAATAASSDPFIEVVPAEGRAPVRIAVAQVVRVARVGDHTVIDTTAWVQQRAIEPVEAVAGRLTAAGQRLAALTDPAGARLYLAADRVVLVREAQARHPPRARAAIVLVGLRFNSDVAVRETVAQVMATLRRVDRR